jgi:hypothetical protein
VIGFPENPTSIPLFVSLDDGRMHTLIYRVPVVYRWTDPVRGEQVRSVDVVPEVTATLGSNVYLFAEAKPRQVAVSLHDFGGAETAVVRLLAPAGWKTDPPSIPVAFDKKDDEARVTFTVTPPPNETTAALTAEVELKSGAKLHMSLTEISYPHIPQVRLFGEAQARLVRAEVKKRGARIGYIMGSGDEVPDALRQIGYNVTLLTDADLESGSFAGYDAIVAGVRAYNTRKRLRVAHPKLMDYVSAGGTYVVQYNTTDEMVSDPGPYPFKLSRDRVTVEQAPVRFVHPDHPLLNTPNRITASDFDAWVQERGLYFTTNWDPRYTTILASNDPGEPEKEGGELYAHYGKGTFIYTSYAWFRQLPAGVPGAYRLFANMVSAK